MPTRFATDQEVADWDEVVARNRHGANVLQTAEFARAKERRGWRARYIVDDSGAHMALERSFLGLGKFWYFPKGPNVSSVAGLQEFAESFAPFARSGGVFGYKIEPEIERGVADSAGSFSAVTSIERLGFMPVGALQVNLSTVIVDLSSGAEAAKAKFKPKHRNAINRAAREGGRAEAVPATEENCRIMYELLTRTAEGQFQVRSFGYYRDMWQDYASSGHGQIFFAYAEDQVIAAAFVMLLGSFAVYKDGASARDKVIFGASHLLQYSIMEWLAERGFTGYDLCGVPPSDRLDDKSHEFHGLGTFKTGFDKNVIDYVGAFDMALVPLKYKLWMALGERALAKLHRRKFGDAMY